MRSEHVPSAELRVSKVDNIDFSLFFSFALCLTERLRSLAVVAAQASRLSNKDSQTVFRGRVALCAHAL